MMHDCPSKDKDLDPKGRKFSNLNLNQMMKDVKDYLSEFYFIAIEEEREENFERSFEELYGETICMAKKRK